jgi:ribose transport system permease protein
MKMADFLNIEEVRPLLAFIALFTIASLLSPYFFTQTNISILMGMMTVTAFAALGGGLVILSGGIDLSVGSQMGLACVLAASLLQFYGFNVAMVFFTVISVVMFIGFMNGIVITKWKIPAFIVTFATMTIVRGVVYLYAPQNIPIYDPTFQALGGNIGIFPIIFVIFGGVAVVFFFLTKYTKLGLYARAVGGNETATRNLGMDVDGIKVLVYTLASLTFALGGIMLAIRTQSSYPLAGSGLELDAICSAVIGGYPLSGGEGSVIGAIVGAALLSVILNIMVLLNINTFWQWVVKGIIVIGAATVYRGKR